MLQRRRSAYADAESGRLELTGHDLRAGFCPGAVHRVFRPVALYREVSVPPKEVDGAHNELGAAHRGAGGRDYDLSGNSAGCRLSYRRIPLEPAASRLFGFHKGFDVFYDDVLLGGSGLARNVKLGLARAQRVFRTDPYVSAQRLNALVMDWLSTAQQPFFLWIHYMDVHGPYLARKVLKYLSPGERVWRKSVAHPERITAAERGILLRNYHRQIELLDAELGRFLPSIESRAPAENRLTIITADHGDEFGEHGGHSHGHKLYDELLHVPLIISLPGALPGRAREITELVQVAPTILEFAGCGASAAGAFDGASLLPRLRGSTQHPGKGYALSEGEMPPHDLISVRTADWKLIRRNGDDRELYHLPADPGERTNLINTSTAASAAAELETKISMHCTTETPEKGLRDAAVVPPIEVSDAEAQLVTQRLRDLGYLG
jgi:Sulfatase